MSAAQISGESSPTPKPSNHCRTSAISSAERRPYGFEVRIVDQANAGTLRAEDCDDAAHEARSFRFSNCRRRDVGERVAGDRSVRLRGKMGIAWLSPGAA